MRGSWRLQRIGLIGASMHTIIVRLFAAACILACTACASTQQERTPWHQYLHDKGLE